MQERSQRMLQIEHDLGLISERIHALEDHFEHDGIIVQLAEALHKIAVELEQIKSQQVGNAE